ncbi:MAG: hypothetical protein C0459_13855 [Chitinophaga sp.]|nr:hypothetical protein [Chitinophaga sp.]
MSLFLATNVALAQTTPSTPVTITKPTEKKPDASSWGIKFSGFVRNDVYYDTRQVVSARPAVQGDLLLYPTNVSNDVNGNDINAASSLTMLAITTRLTGTVTGPDAFGAKTSAIIEGEFFGNANGSEDVFRLRHAYAKLDWEKTQLAFGQYWHPLFVTECYPGVISFNTGIPFQPFARNPQIRLTQKLGKEVNLILAAVSQIEAFVSPGPTGSVALAAVTPSSTFINDAVIPNLHAQLQYKGNSVLLGAAIDYKELRPALSVASAPAAATKVSTNERIKSVSFEAYAKLTTKDVVAKVEYVSGQNLYDQLMIGGYLAYGAAPTITYKPIKVNSFWIDVAGTGKKVVPGIFFGYTKNNGASDVNAVASYSRGISAAVASIDNILRVAPRIEVISGKFKFGTEIEVTTAAYGTADTNAKVTGTTNNVTNTRLLFITSYSF